MPAECAEYPEEGTVTFRSRQHWGCTTHSHRPPGRAETEPQRADDKVCRAGAHSASRQLSIRHHKGTAPPTTHHEHQARWMRIEV
ncbi:hypothetical protein P7K49_008918, partial [Saguinus oedipus]